MTHDQLRDHTGKKKRKQWLVLKEVAVIRVTGMVGVGMALVNNISARKKIEPRSWWPCSLSSTCERESGGGSGWAVA
jgi:hypothetical protein